MIKPQHTPFQRKKIRVIPVNSSGSVKVQNFPFRSKDGVLSRKKVFGHLSTSKRTLFDETIIKTIRVSESTRKDLSFDTNLVFVSLTVQKWHRFKDDIAFSKMKKKRTQFVFVRAIVIERIRKLFLVDLVIFCIFFIIPSGNYFKKAFVCDQCRLCSLSHLEMTSIQK